MEQVDWNSVFIYDETSPTCLRWKEKRKGNRDSLVNRKNDGVVGGRLNASGNYSILFGGANRSLNKIIWLMHYGKIKEGYYVDYLDDDSTNLKISNLFEKKQRVEFSSKYCKELHEYFEYNTDSPSCLVWKQGTGFGSKVKRGDFAGSLDVSNGYYSVNTSNFKYKAHRLVWYLVKGEISDDLEIDHINGDRSDNRIENLRLVPRDINARNKSKNKNNTTGYNMISYDEFYNHRGTLIQRYTVVVSVNRKRKTKSFSCLKYGKEQALAMAVSWRDQELERVNALGAGYTERHGT